MITAPVITGLLIPFFILQVNKRGVLKNFEAQKMPAFFTLGK